VSILLQKLNSFISNSHYAAHWEALAAKDAAESSAYSREFDQIVGGLVVYFFQSPQRTSKLKEVKKELGQKTLQLCKVHKVWWLSRSQAVSSIHRSRPELVSLFNPAQPQGQGDPQPEYFQQLTSFCFLFVLLFLVELLGILSNLNKAFQRLWVDPTQVKHLVEGTIASIEEHFIKPSDEPGRRLLSGLPILVRTFWDRFMEWGESDEAKPFQHMGVEVNFSEPAPEHVAENGAPPAASQGGYTGDAVICLHFLQAYALAVMANLWERFPHRELFEAFAILSPGHYPLCSQNPKTLKPKTPTISRGFEGAVWCLECRRWESV
jgi:hypothetical protein